MNGARHYLDRYAASEAHLSGVLARKVRKRTGAPPDQSAREMIAATIRALREEGFLNDEAFAWGRTQTLKRKGHSAAHARAGLAAKGVGRDLAARMVSEAAFDEVEQVRAAARRLRISPPGAGAPLADRDFARLARRGFSLSAIRAAFGPDAAADAWEADEVP